MRAFTTCLGLALSVVGTFGMATGLESPLAPAAPFGACAGVPGSVDKFVREHFDVKLMEGTFYELAFHDWTQVGYVCGCQRSVKKVDTSVKPELISDLFTLKCPPSAPKGGDQITHLKFNNTEQKGLLYGACNIFSPLWGTSVCPDYVIDVGTRRRGQPYPWVLEFQCVEHPKTGALAFAGINMYARDKSPETLEAMIASAHAHGLDKFINGGFPRGLTVVNHTGCTYPSVDSLP